MPETCSLACYPWKRNGWCCRRSQWLLANKQLSCCRERYKHDKLKQRTTTPPLIICSLINSTHQTKGAMIIYIQRMWISHLTKSWKYKNKTSSSFSFIVLSTGHLGWASKLRVKIKIWDKLNQIISPLHHILPTIYIARYWVHLTWKKKKNPWWLYTPVVTT